MRKKSIVWIIVVSVVVILGIGVWVVLSNNKQTNSPIITPASAEFTDATDKKEVEIAMHDLSYSPAKIKVKKGTRVTWVNQDTVQHNVVAADSGNTGGLPITAATFGRGGTVSHTFAQTGTFDYLCTPHKQFMRGTVQVVD